MPDLSPGSQAYGRDFPPSGFDLDWTSQLNLTTTSYASGTPSVGVNVTAPTSGRVLVALGVGSRNNGANTDRVIVTYRVLEDSSEGREVTPESAYRGVTSPGIGSEEYRYVGNFALEDDLTPGRNYYFQVRHRTISGSATCDIASRSIAVIPVP